RPWCCLVVLPLTLALSPRAERGWGLRWRLLCVGSGCELANSGFREQVRSYTGPALPQGMLSAARCERETERVSARRRVALAPERTVVREEPKRPGNNAGAAQVRAPVNLLAGFAVRLIDGARLRYRGWAGGHFRCRSGFRRGAAEAVAAAVGHGVELAGVNGGLLGAGRGQGTEVVGGFQATVPGHAVGHVELLAAGAGDVEVQRLRLVDPLLAAAGGVDDPLGFHFEGGRVEVFELLRDALDLLYRTVVVLEVVDHHRVPQAARLEVANQVGV